MPRRRSAAIKRGQPSIAATLITLGVALALVVAGCSGDDDAGTAVVQDEPESETTSDFAVEITPPLELLASADPDFIDNVLADDVVTAEELADAQERFIACLTEGGAAGIYAFDLDLRIMAADWSLPSSAAGTNEAASLNASCSRDFLGDLFKRWETTNPADAELATRRRDSIVACVGAVNPEIAANVPEVVPDDTSGAGGTGTDFQLDPTALGAKEGEIEPVRRCLGLYGAEQIAFG